jgi:kynureninase
VLDAMSCDDPSAAEALDAADPLEPFRARFVFEDERRLYLGGNSLGRLPKETIERLDTRLREWGAKLVEAWPEWINLPSGSAIFWRRRRSEPGPAYEPAAGVTRFLAGTPPILDLTAAEVGIRLVAEAGIGAIRQKSLSLTTFAIELHDAWLASLGFVLGTPRAPERRGGHVALRHPDAWRSAARSSSARASFPISGCRTRSGSAFRRSTRGM